MCDCQLKLGICCVSTAMALLRGREGSTSCSGPTSGMDMEELQGVWRVEGRCSEGQGHCQGQDGEGDYKGKEDGSEGGQPTWASENKDPTLI